LQPAVFTPTPLADYCLLDSGDGEKLERCGDVVLRRPDPQALWRPRLDAVTWRGADLRFERESDRGGRWVAWPDVPGSSSPEGRSRRRSVSSDPLEWTVEHAGARFWIRPTAFKHIGLFPEQAVNWDLVERTAPALGSSPRLLNLFGYTGIASVLAARAGYEVTHVDASKTTIEWARDNAQASGLGRDAMRVLCDDALAFARREVRRGSRYHVVLLDPPHYGRGPKGEKWQFEDGIVPLLDAVASLLEARALVILSTYAIGYSPLALANLMGRLGDGVLEAGELALREEGAGGRLLPAGFCARWQRGIETR